MLNEEYYFKVILLQNRGYYYKVIRHMNFPTFIYFVSCSFHKLNLEKTNLKIICFAYFMKSITIFSNNSSTTCTSGMFIFHIHNLYFPFTVCPLQTWNWKLHTCCFKSKIAQLIKYFHWFQGGIWKCLVMGTKESLECCEQSSMNNSSDSSEAQNTIRKTDTKCVHEVTDRNKDYWKCTGGHLFHKQTKKCYLHLVCFLIFLINLNARITYWWIRWTKFQTLQL